MPLDLSTFKAAPTSDSLDSNRAALGHSSQLRMDTFTANGKTLKSPDAPTLASHLSGVAGAGEGFVKGAAKSVVSTVQNLGNALLNPLAKAFGGKNTSGIPDKDLAPASTSEKVGGAAADIGEYFIPGLDSEKLTAGLAEHFGPEAASTFGKILASSKGKAVVKAGIGAAQGAALGGAQSDSAEGALEGGLAGGAAPALSEAAGLAKGSPTLDETLDIINPSLTKNQKIDAIAAGRGEKAGVFSEGKIAANKGLVDVANAVKGIVKKGASGIENIGNIKDAISTEAEGLKAKIAANDHPYTFKELGKAISDAAEPLTLKGTAFEKQIGPIKDAAIKIAQQAGGKISNLLDARKTFDDLVDKEYPNLYDKESAPMRNAITSVRTAMNDFIEKNVPDDVEFSNSMKKQSLMFKAIDNIAGNAVSEVGKGSSMASKIYSKVKGPVVAGLTALGIDKAVKDTTGFGL